MRVKNPLRREPRLPSVRVVAEVSTLRLDLDETSTEVDDLKSEVDDLKSKVEELETWIQTTRDELSDHRRNSVDVDDFERVNEEVQGLTVRVTDLAHAVEPYGGGQE